MPPLTNLLRGLGGAALGAVVGYFGFAFIARQGLYAGLLPGAAVGIGCGLASGTRSKLLAALCGVAGLAAGVLTEWHVLPFVDNPSLSFFVQNIVQKTMHLAMLVGGALFAVYFGYGSARSTPTAD